jgi:hypothetical protein
MRTRLFPIILLLGLAGCAGQSSIKPVEGLDERTGMTVGSLKEPIEFVPGVQNAAFIARKRASFAYLGPVEWDRSGTISYGLWVHIAPGNGQQPGDIRASGTVTLLLDDGPLVLSPIEAPKLGREPYRQVVSWGQTSYFDLTAEALRHLAASRKFELNVRATDGSIINFSPTGDTHAVLTQYVHARGITGD